MDKMSSKFGLPESLLDAVKKIQTEETEYQMKVKALMKKKGITSLGQLSPDEKKAFFSQLDSMHQAKNEEFGLSEGMLSKFKKADAQTKTDFNKYNMKPYDAVYTVTMGDKGEPKYDLTILKHENGKFLAAHGSVVVKQEFSKAEDAAKWLMNWYEENKRPAAKNESVEESTGVTDYNPKSQGGTRKELIAKYHKTKNPKDAEAARKAGATQKELQSEEVEIDEMDKSQPSSSRGAEGLPTGKKATPITVDKVKNDALKALQRKYKTEDMKSVASEIETYAMKHGGIDKADMMKVANLLKMGKMSDAKKKVMSMDTDPRDFLLDKMKKLKIDEASSQYKIKSVGKDAKGDYHIDPKTGDKVYGKASVGDHKNPNTGKITSSKPKPSFMEENELEESGDMGPVNRGKEKTVMMRHKTSGKEIVVVPSGVKEKEKLGFVVVKEEKHPEDVKTSANKMEPEGTKKWLATHATHLKYLKQVKKDKLQEAEGGGTSISNIKSDAQGALKRAELLKKSAELRLQHAQERQSLSKQKKSLSKEQVEFIDEEFSDAQLAKLRAEYGKLNTIDPSSDNYKKLTAMLDKMDKQALTKIAGANIKFMSGLARNRVNRMKNEEVEELDETPKVDQGLSGKQKVMARALRRDDSPIINVGNTTGGQWRGKTSPSPYKDSNVAKSGERKGMITKSAIQRTKDAIKSRLNKLKKEEVEIEEGKSSTGYELYHKDFSSAMAHAYDFAKKKYNIEIDPFEIDRKVAMGPKKPSSGKSNAYRLLDKTGKKGVQIQVANLDDKRYELNMYKEEIEMNEVKVGDKVTFDHEMTAAPGRTTKKSGIIHKIEGDVAHVKVKDKYGVIVHKKKMSELQNEEIDLEEKVVKGKGYDNPENERKGPEGKIPMTSLMPGHSDKAARFAAVQAKGTLVKGKAQSAPQKAPQKEAADAPEFKQGGDKLAKKFEKAFAKMGLKTNIKMKTVDNVSINEKEEGKKDKEASAKQKAVKKGETLSGKQEPIKIDPEISDK